MYEPSEDSELLRDAILDFLSKRTVNNALDMGTGSGIQALTMVMYVKYVLATDIDKEAIAALRKIILEKGLLSKMEAIVSDLFSNVPRRFEKGFDIIVFNPPYLPKGEEDYEDSELFSGADGIRITKDFLVQAPRFLTIKGVLFFVASSLAKISVLEHFMLKNNYKFEVVRKKHISFEDILVYKAWLNGQDG